ncbi:hypothetical protein EB796_014486 [Bugula neritina]|uniref:Uncharacterized protein n=1 Tax=Bugula neritina TaxID=10212 RepID=A0A7J7JP71_BUGNE|nr:hypothetical protein EB796_014486 [Bugula neritina]
MEQLLNDKAFESQGQLQSANQEIEKLKEQLADRERQLITSPTQEELLELKHSLSERESALEDKDLLLSTYSQQVKDLETQVQYSIPTVKLSALLTILSL